MPTSHGYRVKTRQLLKKKYGSRSGPRPDIYLKEYKPGDKVLIVVDPAVQKGMPHKRFYGKVGTVISKRGNAYEVSVMLGNKLKKLLLLSDHIRPWEGG
ncbi:MAG: 50S ribosomal protein L21e [Nitrososphaerota archaeon]